MTEKTVFDYVYTVRSQAVDFSVFCLIEIIDITQDRKMREKAHQFHAHFVVKK